MRIKSSYNIKKVACCITFNKALIFLNEVQTENQRAICWFYKSITSKIQAPDELPSSHSSLLSGQLPFLHY